ncbi:hypothetical protein BV25DRAFT_1828591 [Artomyces pyxidatus]|uniref:Uncharacterized protein n=1 Tax=Artomyces pyxidatus TaxID=48021 RepID=A0ACB8STN8_9AGAM|nr:hypothetical protein BV25DRAFT_1828591 [Artomyces pyxidatus]
MATASRCFRIISCSFSCFASHSISAYRLASSSSLPVSRAVRNCRTAHANTHSGTSTVTITIFAASSTRPTMRHNCLSSALSGSGTFRCTAVQTQASIVTSELHSIVYRVRQIEMSVQLSESEVTSKGT